MRIYEAVKPLEPGRAVDVVARDENGFLVGAYFGYWNFRRGTVALYPNVKNRFVNWPGGRIPSSKIVVSDRSVKIRNSEFGVRNDTSSVSNADTFPSRGRLEENGLEKKAEIKGQERMDI